MFYPGTLSFWLCSLLATLAVWLLVGKRVLSFEAKDRRRRERNYGRVTTRRPRPGIKFAVKAR